MNDVFLWEGLDILHMIQFIAGLNFFSFFLLFSFSYLLYRGFLLLEKERRRYIYV